MPIAIPKQVIAEVDAFSSRELDGLPFGAIQLDRAGTILQFNEYEANLSNRRAPDTVGRNFFTEVAPCTNVREFHGRFAEGMETGELHVTFDYVFAFKPHPRDVRVTLYYSAATETVWVFVEEKK
jgi:photoactive yellow protein